MGLLFWGESSLCREVEKVEEAMGVRVEGGVDWGTLENRTLMQKIQSRNLRREGQRGGRRRYSGVRRNAQNEKSKENREKRIT